MRFLAIAEGKILPQYYLARAEDDKCSTWHVKIAHYQTRYYLSLENDAISFLERAVTIFNILPSTCSGLISYLGT
jgi:hypothetical protein